MENNTPANTTSLPAGLSQDAEQDNILHTFLEGYSVYVRPYIWLDILAVILFLIGGIVYLKRRFPYIVQPVSYMSTVRI